MQIAITPNAATWVVVPEFPPPGWERAEARRRTIGAAGVDPQRRSKLENLLTSLRNTERRSPMARLLHMDDDARGRFVVDLGLVLAHDDGSKEGRHTTQLALLGAALPGSPTVHGVRPDPGTAGFWALAPEGKGVGTISRAAAVVVLRKAGLPTVPVDIVMRVWWALPSEVAPFINEVIALANDIAPADTLHTPRPPQPTVSTAHTP